MKFQLGQIVATRAVADRMNEDENFAKLVTDSIYRHGNGDWGVTCKEDCKTNNEALKCGDRVMSAWTIDPSQGESKGYGDNTLWIITEADRSVTTVLYPDEY